MSGHLQGEFTYIFEYIWTDNKGNCRSKTKIYYSNKFDIDDIDIPKWVYDGSSTGQAVTNNSEVILNPVTWFKDPFRPSVERAFLVLCETELPNGQPHPDNYRRACKEFMQKYRKEKPLFGYEQEFFVIDSKTDSPILYTMEKRIANNINTTNSQKHIAQLGKHCIINGSNTQGMYYCGVGSHSVGYRDAINQAVDNCLTAKLNITGMNFEVAPGQCEIQVCTYGIDAADQLIMLRYILQRTLESYGLYACFRTKPEGLFDPSEGPRFNASGCHTNFSTLAMRQPGGLDTINRTIKAFSENHETHMKEYGPGNRKRLTGQNETSSYDSFSSGVASRAVSIRIPLQVQQKRCGYFEDRRPSSAMNPYRVSLCMFKTYINANHK